MKLTKDFTLSEFTYSEKAKKLGILNKPNDIHIQRLKTLCEKVLQPARDYFNVEFDEAFIKITSGYRNRKLSEAVGSSTRSFHYFGFAADCELYLKKNDVWVEDNKSLFHYIKNELPFTELINEYDYSWIHVAYNPEDDRQMVKIIK